MPDKVIGIEVIENIIKKKKQPSIPEFLGIKQKKWDEISKDVYGNVFTFCCKGEGKIIREIFPEIKDTEKIAKLIIFAKAMGRLYAEEGHHP